MVGNTASVGWNLTKGLREKGVDVVFVGNKSNVTSGDYDYVLDWKTFLRKKYGKKHFDIAHIHSPNFKKLGASWKYIKNAKLVCHWHGSDLRIPKKAFPVYHFLKRRGNYHLYSTVDLGWWLRKIPENKRQRFLCPVDTERFKPNGLKNKGMVTMSGGGSGFNKHKVIHDEMPGFLNQFEKANVYDTNVDERLFSVAVFEAVACGLQVKQFPWMDRNWVLENASINSQTEKVFKIYIDLLKAVN